MVRSRRVWHYFRALFWGDTSRLDPAELDALLQKCRDEMVEVGKEKLARQKAVKLITTRNHLRKQVADMRERAAHMEADAVRLQNEGRPVAASDVRRKQAVFFGVGAKVGGAISRGGSRR